MSSVCLHLQLTFQGFLVATPRRVCCARCMLFCRRGQKDDWLQSDGIIAYIKPRIVGENCEGLSDVCLVTDVWFCVLSTGWFGSTRCVSLIVFVLCTFRFIEDRSGDKVCAVCGVVGLGGMGTVMDISKFSAWKVRENSHHDDSLAAEIKRKILKKRHEHEGEFTVKQLQKWRDHLHLHTYKHSNGEECECYGVKADPTTSSCWLLTYNNYCSAIKSTAYLCCLSAVKRNFVN